MDKKNKKKVFLFTVLLLLLIFLAFPFLVSAQTVISISNPLKIKTIQEFLDAVKVFLWALVAPLSTIILIWIGILFITSEGNPEKIKKAKQYLFYVIIGIFVALLATGLAEVIKSIMQ